MKILKSITLICVLASAALADFQDRTLVASEPNRMNNESYFVKPVQIIDCPTASILRGGHFRAGIRAYQQGGLLASLSVGISSRIMFGVSYGGLHIIGAEQQVKWNPMPGVHFVYRIFDESMRLPAFVIGFDSQGYGPHFTGDPDDPAYDEKINGRYDFKSRGFYTVVSKGYSTFIDAGLHAGASYSLENDGSESAPTLFMGADLHLAPDLALLMEYDFAINDNHIHSKGIFNIGVRWAFGPNMFFEFDLKNMLGSDDKNPDVRRILKLTYYGSVLQ